MAETGGKHSADTEHASASPSKKLRLSYSPTGREAQVSSLPLSETPSQNVVLLSRIASNSMVSGAMSTGSAGHTAATAVQLTDFDYMDWDVYGPSPPIPSNSPKITNAATRELPCPHSEHLAIAANLRPAYPTISQAATCPPAQPEPLSSPVIESNNEDADHASVRPAESQSPSRKDCGTSHAVSPSLTRPNPAVYYHALVKEEQRDARSSKERAVDSTPAQTGMPGESEQPNAPPPELEPLDFDAAVGNCWKQQQNETKTFVNDIMMELAQLTADTQLWASLKITEIDEQGHERLSEQIGQIDRMEQSDHRARRALDNFAQLTRVALDNVRFIDDCL